VCVCVCVCVCVSVSVCLSASVCVFPRRLTLSQRRIIMMISAD